MGAVLRDSPTYFLALGLLCGLLGFRLARRGGRYGLPFIQGAAGGVAFATAWMAHGAGFAALAVAGWAAGTTWGSVLWFARRPEEADRIVLRAAPYREEMLAWLRTGRGPEAAPLRTAGRHVAELALYLILAVLSGNLLSLVLGAVLLNSMNAYVARLQNAARRPWTVRLMAWNAWSVVRVAGYVLLGTAAAQPAFAWWGRPAEPELVSALAWTGLALAAADLILKLTLSRPWGRRLAAAVDLERASAP